MFGVIASTTAPFCGSCDRSRLTADGAWYTCLYAREAVDLRGALRAGASPGRLAELIADKWRGRTDRGAEARLSERRLRKTDFAAASPSHTPDELKRDPHLEMHTRGG